MIESFDKALPAVLKHEGGYVNHPKDPGGATNKGITIGTLKRLKIDVDGDGDSDLVDLKSLRHSDLRKVYKLFYWDQVMGDYLPAGVDYAMFDFAVNSGPSRAISTLQRVLRVPVDGELGPVTLAALVKADRITVINGLCDRRMLFLKQLNTWGTFGKGWTSRVGGVRLLALDMAGKSPETPVQPASAPAPAVAAYDVKPPPAVKSEAPTRLGWIEWVRRVFA